MFVLTLASLAAAEPEIGSGFVLTPNFATTEGKFSAGTAFPLDVGIPGQPMIVTAHHLFGPAGGLKAPVAAKDLGGFVSGVTLYDTFSQKQAGKALTPLSVADAAPMEKTAKTDIALFMAEKAKLVAMSSNTSVVLKPRKLAAAGPAKGDTVWLAAKVQNKGATKLHKATVVEVNPDWLFYEYAAADLDLTATSGAAILNDAGDVVGINLGGGPMDGKLIGSANPWSAVKERVEAATPK